MRAGLKGQMFRTLALAHTTEAFARVKRLKPLDVYVKALSKKTKKGQDQSAELLAMFRRYAKAQAKDGSADGGS